jgi:hypothetical protein
LSGRIYCDVSGTVATQEVRFAEEIVGTNSPAVNSRTGVPMPLMVGPTFPKHPAEGADFTALGRIADVPDAR